MSATFHPAPDATRPQLKPRIKGGTFYDCRKPERTLGTKELHEAQRLYDQRGGIKKIKNGAIRNEAAFTTWVETHKLNERTRDIYRGVWKNWVPAGFKGKLVSEIEPEDIIALLAFAKNEPSKKTGELLAEDGGLAHIYVCLSSYFTSMTKLPTRYRTDNPVAGIGAFKPETNGTGEVGVDEVLTPKEVEQLIGLAGIASHPNRWDEVLMAKQLSLLVEILAFGGMRIGEALALEIDDLLETKLYGEWHIRKQLNLKRDIEDPQTWFAKLKGKPGKIGSKTRFVPIMNAGLRSRIDAYVAEGIEGRWLKPGGLLFPTEKGKPRTVSGLDRRFQRLRDDAGMGERHREKAVVLHHLRHTFVSWLLESGQYDITGIALLIGDKLKTTTDRYAHMADRSRRDEAAVAAMAARHGEPVAPSPTPADNVVHVAFGRAV